MFPHAYFAPTFFPASFFPPAEEMPAPAATIIVITLVDPDLVALWHDAA